VTPLPTAFDCVRAAAATFFMRPLESLTADTRIDDLEPDELRVIDFMATIECECRCDLPDFEIGTTATLGQLAVLVEKHRK